MMMKEYIEREAAAPGSHPETTAALATNQQPHHSTIKRQTKQSRILAELASGGSLNRFEAERIGDHVLHTTVSKIERLGIRVSRRTETVPGYDGHATHVCRYWLDDENRERAAAMLGL
ncbi:MAG: hypothetical protein ACOY5W_07575 [Pseudomonadota bacterium]